MSFSINTIYSCLFRIWRARRFRVFLERLAPDSAEILIDVGGNPLTWTEFPQPVARIDSLNIRSVEWDEGSYPNHNIHTLVGDGCAMDFPDFAYDIVFSNSVIEHLGSFERQRKFASEVRRVGRRIWLQTPAFECPIEPHFLAPLVHWLPKGLRKMVVRWMTPRGWLERPTKQDASEMVESIRHLRKSEMEELFPDCEIMIERLCGIIPKSYIAIRNRVS